jgi:hypothetical protein
MIALLLVIGCSVPLPAVTTSPSPQSAEAVIVERVIAAWNARGDLPELDAEELREVLVTDAVDERTFRRDRPGCSARPSASSSCTRPRRQTSGSHSSGTG